MLTIDDDFLINVNAGKLGVQSLHALTFADAVIHGHCCTWTLLHTQSQVLFAAPAALVFRLRCYSAMTDEGRLQEDPNLNLGAERWIDDAL